MRDCLGVGVKEEPEMELSHSAHAQPLLNVRGKDKTRYLSLRGLQSTAIMKQNA